MLPRLLHKRTLRSLPKGAREPHTKNTSHACGRCFDVVGLACEVRSFLWFGAVCRGAALSAGVEAMIRRVFWNRENYCDNQV